MLIGYARVSTGDQSLTLQIDALEEAGCERVFQDQVSGIVNSRPNLNQALNFARPGDTLVVWRLDRLSKITAISNRDRDVAGTPRSSV